MRRKLWKTKTFWAGIASVATGVGLVLNEQYGEGATAILLGIGMITGRDAVKKLEDTKNTIRR